MTATAVVCSGVTCGGCMDMNGCTTTWTCLDTSCNYCPQKQSYQCLNYESARAGLVMFLKSEIGDISKFTCAFPKYLPGEGLTPRVREILVGLANTWKKARFVKVLQQDEKKKELKDGKEEKDGKEKPFGLPVDEKKIDIVIEGKIPNEEFRRLQEYSANIKRQADEFSERIKLEAEKIITGTEILIGVKIEEESKLKKTILALSEQLAEAVREKEKYKKKYEDLAEYTRKVKENFDNMSRLLSS